MVLKRMWEDKETRGFIIGFAASVVTSVISLIIFYDFFAEKIAQKAITDYKRDFGIMSHPYQTSDQTHNQMSNRGLFKMSPNPTTLNLNNTESPTLELSITTCELDDDTNTWIPVLTHTFHGNSEKEINGLIDAHKQTDIFFKASFEGTFNWKGGTIRLKNIDSGISHS